MSDDSADVFDTTILATNEVWDHWPTTPAERSACGSCGVMYCAHDPEVARAGLADNCRMDDVTTVNCEQCGWTRTGNDPKIAKDWLRHHMCPANDVNVTVTVTDGPVRPVWQTRLAIAVTVVLVALMFGWLYWLAVAVACVAMLGLGVAIAIISDEFGHGYAKAEKQKAHAELIARADQQHNWVMQGDPRGTFGVATRTHLQCTKSPRPKAGGNDSGGSLHQSLGPPAR